MGGIAMICADAGLLLSERLDGRLTPDAAHRLDAHLAACPACRTAAREMAAERELLAHHWPAVAAPAGFAARVADVVATGNEQRATSNEQRETATANLIARCSLLAARYPLPVAALAAALVLVALLGVAAPPVRGGLRLALERVLLRETTAPTAERLIDPGAVVALDDARRQVPWRIRLPARLPEGYRLVAVTVGEVHEDAIGPTVVLHYQQGDGPRAPALRITELRVARPLDEPIAPGAATELRVDGRPALLIDGAWEERDGQTVWTRGTLLRLILQDGDLVVQLEGEPRDGWERDALIRVAESLR
jgi:anti-sigma factor RsiW